MYFRIAWFRRGAPISLQVIDPRALSRLKKLGGDELVHRMIDLFLPHVQSKVDAARSAAASGKLEELERAAHSIRSSSGNLGDELGYIAGEVERLASGKRSEEVAQLLPGLEAAFSRARRRLEQERGAGTCDGSL
jgi:two-component system, sensor histidine kinase and response regulator